jgi:hypothetical protein
MVGRRERTATDEKNQSDDENPHKTAERDRPERSGGRPTEVTAVFVTVMATEMMSARTPTDRRSSQREARRSNRCTRTMGGLTESVRRKGYSG